MLKHERIIKDYLINKKGLDHKEIEEIFTKDELNKFEVNEEFYKLEHLEEQLQELQNEGLLDYYLYQADKNNLPICDDDYNLFADILNGNIDKEAGFYWE